LIFGTSLTIFSGFTAHIKVNDVQNIEKRSKIDGIIPGVGICFSEMGFYPGFSNDWGVVLCLGYWVGV
jgi:hypothetical protein